MRAIAAKNDMEQIRDLKNLLFAANTENHRVRYYTNSYHHSLKLRITQALAFLFRLDPAWDDRMLKIILEEANQINVTHINELIIAETIDPAQMLQIIRSVSEMLCCFNVLIIDFILRFLSFDTSDVFLSLFRLMETKECSQCS